MTETLTVDPAQEAVTKDNLYRIFQETPELSQAFESIGWEAIANPEATLDIGIANFAINSVNAYINKEAVSDLNKYRATLALLNLITVNEVRDTDVADVEQVRSQLLQFALAYGGKPALKEIPAITGRKIVAKLVEEV